MTRVVPLAVLANHAESNGEAGSAAAAPARTDENLGRSHATVGGQRSAQGGPIAAGRSGTMDEWQPVMVTASVRNSIQTGRFNFMGLL
ncbi:MAG: hypothetical protein ACP5I8_05000 [Phycisphaerae bacterium]